MADENNIFDLSNKFGIESPFDNWLKKENNEKSPWDALILSIDAFPNYNAPGSSQLGPKLSVPPNSIFSNANIREDNSDYINVAITVNIYIQNKADKVEVTLKDKSTKTAQRNFVNDGLYEANFNVKVFKSKAPKDQYNIQEFTFKADVYDLFKKTITDTKNLTVKIDTNGKILNKVTYFPSEIIEYHVYANSDIEKWIPKGYDNNKKVGKIKYVYHDTTGKSYDIAEVDFHFAQKRKNGIRGISSIPTGYIDSYDYPSGGNAQKAYLYEDGDIYAKGTVYGIRKYPQDTGFVQLIRMPDNLNIQKESFKMIYSFRNSQRRYCNPETFAGYIGALAEISSEVKCTGMCFDDATSYPSVTHPNGDSADTAYFSSLKKEQKKVDAFHKFHFQNILRGSSSWYSQLNHTSYSSGHEDHLHAGDFDSSVVKQKVIF